MVQRNYFVLFSVESMPDVLDISSDEELGLEEGLKGVDYDWIMEFLGVSDKESDDSDDVIVVHEQKPERKSKPSRPAAIESDDDCVVLDGDPENAITSVNKSATESDELIVVGEKGQVEMWKIQRKNFKLKKSAPLPASTNYGSSLPVENSQPNQVLALGISQMPTNSISRIQTSRLTTTTCSLTLPIPQNNDHCPPIIHACSSLNSTIQNQASRAHNIHVCSSTTNYTAPNCTNHGRCQESASTFIRNRCPPSFVSRPRLGVRNNAFQRDRQQSSFVSYPQYPHRMLASNGLGNAGGTLTVNHSAHASSGYSNHVNPTVRCNKYYDPPGLTNNGWLPANLSSYPHSSSARSSLNYNGENTVTSEIQAYIQPSRLENSQSFHQSCVQGNDAPSKDVACLSSNLCGNGHQIGSQMESASGDITQWGNSCQQEPVGDNRSETATKAVCSYVDLVLNDNSIQSVEPQIENSQPPISRSINQPPQNENPDPPFAGSTNLSSLTEFEDWLMEKDNALPSEMNALSPDPVPGDTGALFCDFEASWNGLAHA